MGRFGRGKGRFVGRYKAFEKINNIIFII